MGDRAHRAREASGRQSLRSTRVPRPRRRDPSARRAVTAFVADTLKAKRATLVERLMTTPAFADYWAEVWDDILLGREVRQTARRSARDASLATRALRGEHAVERDGHRTPHLQRHEQRRGQRGRGSYPRGRMDMVRMDDATSATAVTTDTRITPAHGDADRVNGAVNFFTRYDGAPQDPAGRGFTARCSAYRSNARSATITRRSAGRRTISAASLRRSFASM